MFLNIFILFHKLCNGLSTECITYKPADVKVASNQNIIGKQLLHNEELLCDKTATNVLCAHAITHES